MFIISLYISFETGVHRVLTVDDLRWPKNSEMLKLNYYKFFL
jgi:hypothetical protein